MDDRETSLNRIASEPIRQVVQAAVADGNAVSEVADWSKAVVVHMRDGLSPGLRDRLKARFRDLTWYEAAGTPHNEPDEGFVDGVFSVSFPLPRR